MAQAFRAVVQKRAAEPEGGVVDENAGLDPALVEAVLQHGRAAERPEIHRLYHGLNVIFRFKPCGKLQHQRLAPRDQDQIAA